ncbi:MAG: trypsin-like peptidase domain-containing protein [Sedimentisphaerales bacterium]|nr:trypsin-like peptidase domain-containing protein [Sedimentisphaerales bacterium]
MSKINKILWILIALLILSTSVHSQENTSDDLTSLVQKVQAAVVTIICYGADGSVSKMGTGFFINEQGHLITCYHVLALESKADIKTIDGKKYPVKLVIAEDSFRDLIKVYVDIPQSEIHYLELSDDDTKIAEEIVIIGSPLGFLEQTVSKGIISGFRDTPENERRIRDKDDLRKTLEKQGIDMSGEPKKPSDIPNLNDMDAKKREKIISDLYRYNESKNKIRIDQIYQTDASVSPGSSGSPMINRDGKVVGMATALLTGGQNLNFAVSAHAIHAMQDLREGLLFDTWSNQSIKTLMESDEKTRERGQDWVVPFKEQLEKNNIWNGKRLYRQKNPENHIHTLLDGKFSSRRSVIYPKDVIYDRGLYEYQGHYYTENELSFVKPDRDIKVMSFNALRCRGEFVRNLRNRLYLVALHNLGTMGIINLEPPASFSLNDNSLLSRSSRSRSRNQNSYPRMDTSKGSIFSLDLIRTGQTHYVEIDKYKIKLYEYRPSTEGEEIIVPAAVDPELFTDKEHLWTIYCQGLEADLDAGLIVPDPDCLTCSGKGFIKCPLCQGEQYLRLNQNFYLSPGAAQELDKAPKHLRPKKYKCPADCNSGRVGCPACVLIERPLYTESAREKYLKRWK